MSGLATEQLSTFNGNIRHFSDPLFVMFCVRGNSLNKKYLSSVIRPLETFKISSGLHHLNIYISLGESWT